MLKSVKKLLQKKIKCIFGEKFKNMKKVFISLATALILSSCGTFEEIGNVEMISSKTIQNNPNNYDVISSPKYKNKEIRKKAEKSIDLAIDKELSNYPGATHIVNARIYFVETAFGTKKYAVIGDIVKSR